MLNNQTSVLRPLLWKEIRQCRKTGYLCATDLLKLHNTKTWEKKEVKEFRKLKNTQDYEAFLNGENSTHLGSIVTKRGNKGATRMHPKMFIDFACWLSVEFKDWVYTIVIDHLIDARNANSDAFKKMQAAVKDHIGYGYVEEIEMINLIVTGSRAKNQRKRLSEDQQKRMETLQKSNTTLIKMWADREKRRNYLSRLCIDL